MNFRKIKFRLILLIISSIIMTIGLIGLLSVPLIQIFLNSYIPHSIELPLGGLRGIAVDSKGNIYCGLQSYSRVQVYDPNGNYIYGIFFNCSGGAFKFRINSKDQLEVATARNDKFYTFDSNGKKLEELSNVNHYFNEFGDKSEYYCIDTKRDITYRIKPVLLTLGKAISPFGSHVVKKDTFGEEIVIIKTPFYKWLFMGPFPAFVFIIIGNILLFIFSDRFRDFVLRFKKDE